MTRLGLYHGIQPINHRMKTGIKSLVILLATFGAVGGAAAVSVTYNVNMSVQTALGNFHPGVDTVLVSGTFCNLTTTNVMAQSVSDTNVYTLTFDDTSDSVGGYENHQFVINPNGDSSGSSLIWESTGNRYFQVPATGTNLPVVFFDDATNLPTYTVNITFQLDMQIAVQQRLFNMESDYVDAFGSFNNWATTGVLLTNVPGTTNYIGTFTTTALATNMVVNYKYAIDGYGGTWEGNVGAGGAQNRSFTLTSTNQILPVDFWNNITNADSSFNVTFQVDMTVEDALGNFTPGSDVVFVNGDWDWSGEAEQLTQVSGSDVYTGTVALAYSPGTVVNYKYTLNGGLVWENDGVGPGGAQNHQFTLTGDTNLPTDYFNNYSNLGPLNISEAGAQTILSWASGTNANNRIRLQNSTNLLTGWTDVANTQGRSSITNNFGNGPNFFRLIGP